MHSLFVFVLLSRANALREARLHRRVSQDIWLLLDRDDLGMLAAIDKRVEDNRKKVWWQRIALTEGVCYEARMQTLSKHTVSPLCSGCVRCKGFKLHDDDVRACVCVYACRLLTRCVALGLVVAALNRARLLIHAYPHPRRLRCAHADTKRRSTSRQLVCVARTSTCWKSCCTTLIAVGCTRTKPSKSRLRTAPP